jgi:hypothetical protein
MLLLSVSGERVVEWVRKPGSEPIVGDDASITF